MVLGLLCRSSETQPGAHSATLEQSPAESREYGEAGENTSFVIYHNFGSKCS